MRQFFFEEIMMWGRLKKEAGTLHYFFRKKAFF